ncbi:hypothetical protein [Seohaeicola zhoushanensis]|uniref:Uncharacterized protein n=1 Tax=Seohaeicola zhoushanensis TaxID=1569283 RepID=A0A8J3H0I2_9RHOB|nr:hypothetical protein [Seohaeicola zhoushanensis]GHF67940.1 hypothetical protein GCM10017056_43920 [Seohaeicola zhoushanensis]
MAKDLKALEKDVASLSKDLADVLKRLRYNEDRIKILADALTSEKDIEKLLDALYDKMSREASDNVKSTYNDTVREMELREKREAARNKEFDAEIEKSKKEAQKYTDEALKEFEKMKIESRLQVLEAKVASLGR